MSAVRSQKALAIGAPLAIEGAALLRSVVLAHAIGADELGRAMMLALVLRLAEMISDMGVERLLVQAPEGPTPALQADLHGALLLRGVALGALLLCVAMLLPVLTTDGPSFASYALLAIVPVLRGLLHLDYRRAEKGYRYHALALVEGGAAVVMLAALVVSIVAGLEDHRAMLAALIAQAAAQLVLSHTVAERRWTVALRRAGLLRVLRFGAPLALNAGLMFLTLQADRLIVAAGWDWSTLAVYGIVAQLALLPAQVFGRAANSLLLPSFARARADGADRAALTASLRMAGQLGLGFTLAFAALAPAAIALVYGAEYAPQAALALALGAAAGLRIARTPLSIHAVACGRTADTTRANLWRAAALLPGLGAALLGLPLAAFALTAALGELAALIAGLRLSLTRQTREVFA